MTRAPKCLLGGAARALLLLVPLAGGGGACSFLVDFDDIEGLKCPCDEKHVCLVPAQTCRKRNSVDDFKSCDLGADRPDDLCRQNSICQRVNGVGLRCLPTCTPSNYATPEAARNILAQCAPGTTCWETERGGVCSEGICNDIPNNCPAPQQCVRFNGAGVCFTPCQIFQRTPCGGPQICHPIGDSAVTACIKAGPVRLNEICTDREMCAQLDPDSRPMVCDLPLNSSELSRRCRAVCICAAGQASCDSTRCQPTKPCAIARPNVDPTSHDGLGLCIE